MNINRLVALKSGFEIAFLSATPYDLSCLKDTFKHMLESDPENTALQELVDVIWLRHCFLSADPSRLKTRYTRQEAEAELQATYDFAKTLMTVKELAEKTGKSEEYVRFCMIGNRP